VVKGIWNNHIPRIDFSGVVMWCIDCHIYSRCEKIGRNLFTSTQIRSSVPASDSMRDVVITHMIMKCQLLFTIL
jgi:hypothetical protein